jgi:membrane protease YdiL (CAAX protease family)
VVGHMAGQLTAVLVVLVAANVWVHAGPRWTHLATQPAAAVLLLLLGRRAGLSWCQLGLGRSELSRAAVVCAAAAVAVAVGYVLVLAVPATHPAFLDTRYDVRLRRGLWTALVVIPLSTVVLEECAFRGVLWGLVEVEAGPAAATGVSSALFGIWHVLPALDLTRTSTAAGGGGAGPRRRLAVVVGTVLGTTLAGVLLAELRRRSGSLGPPIALHWAANGAGVLASAWVWNRRRRGGSARGRGRRHAPGGPAVSESGMSESGMSEPSGSG